jgi:hypothetical protein
MANATLRYQESGVRRKKKEEERRGKKRKEGIRKKELKSSKM